MPRRLADRRKAWMDYTRNFKRVDDGVKLRRRKQTAIAAHLTVVATAAAAIVHFAFPAFPGPIFWEGVNVVIRALSGLHP